MGRGSNYVDMPDMTGCRMFAWSVCELFSLSGALSEGIEDDFIGADGFYQLEQKVGHC